VRINPKAMRAQLAKKNLHNDFDTHWQSYFSFYGLSVIVEEYDLSVGLLEVIGQQTVFQHYRHSSNAQGTCIIVHGYMDHSAIYRHLIIDRLSAGWDVLIYDKIGHGLSSGESYSIDSFSQYAQQLEQVLGYLAGHCDKQWMIVGQSTGGAVVMEHALNPVFKTYRQISQRILLAPLVKSSGFTVVKIQYYLLRLFLQRIKRGRSNNSHDLLFLDFIHMLDPLSSRWVKVAWVGAMLDWEKYFLSYNPVKENICIIQGDGDETVDWHYNLKAIKQQFPNAQLLMIEGAKHHLVNEGEKWRQQVFTKIKQLSA